MRLLLFLAPLVLFGQDTRNVTEPVIPPVCTTLAAKLDTNLPEADETKLDTSRIQEALDHCEKGKAVELKVAGGHNAFLSGPLELRAGVTLLIGAATTLLASRNPRDFDVSAGACGIVNQAGRGCKPLISVRNVNDAAVMGEGTIDGRGNAKLLGQKASWWDLAEQARAGGNQNCPRLVVTSHSDNFTLYRITLKNSPNFHVVFGQGNGFTAWGVTINTPGKGARNTDGIDPSNATNVTITHCFIHTGDDNVAIKAGSAGPSTHMTISHNHFYDGHGMSIGSETDGGASAIRVTDLSIDGADNGLRIKSNVGRGGLVRDIVYEDVCIRNTKNPIYMDPTYTAAPTGAGDKPPTFTEITMRNVRIEGAGKITLKGLDAQHPLGIAFDNVTIDAMEKFDASHADIQFGPGPVNFRPAGDNVKIAGNPGKGKFASCESKFLPLP
jgi:polygalacturonase